MTTDETYFECAYCDKPYSKEKLSKVLVETNIEDIRYISYNCVRCNKGFAIKYVKENSLEQIRNANLQIKEVEWDTHDENADYNDIPVGKEYYDDIPAETSNDEISGIDENDLPHVDFEYDDIPTGKEYYDDIPAETFFEEDPDKEIKKDRK